MAGSMVHAGRGGAGAETATSCRQQEIIWLSVTLNEAWEKDLKARPQQWHTSSGRCGQIKGVTSCLKVWIKGATQSSNLLQQNRMFPNKATPPDSVIPYEFMGVKYI